MKTTRYEYVGPNGIPLPEHVLVPAGVDRHCLLIERTCIARNEF